MNSAVIAVQTRLHFLRQVSMVTAQSQDAESLELNLKLVHSATDSSLYQQSYGSFETYCLHK